MRTTLTLDADLAAALKERAHATRRTFKEVVNEAIRRGLGTGAPPLEPPEPFRVDAQACGFRAGIDRGKLNQLVDEIALEDHQGLTLHDRLDADDPGKPAR